MTDDLIGVERDGGVALVRVHRPPVNALDLAVIKRLETAFRELVGQPDVRAIVLAGLPGSFCAGLDLKAVPAYGPDEQRQLITGINRTLELLYGAPLPVVAAITGHAIAGGLCIALACDYRVGPAGAARFGLTEGRVGIPFPVTPMVVVQSELPPHAARKLTLLAGLCDAQEALALGALDELQPPDRVVARALEVARDLAGFPGDAYGRIKLQLRAPALARIREAVDRGDPLLERWLAAGVAEAAAGILHR